MRLTARRDTAPGPWRVLWAAVGAQAAGASLIGGLPALSDEIRRTYGLTVGELGVALASVPAGFALTLLAWGATADRRGERPVMAAGLVGAAAAMVVAARAPGLGVLLVALVAAGMLAAATNAASGRVIAAAFGPERRGFALGIRQASLPVGAAMAAAVLPPVAAAASVGVALGVVAAVLAAAGVVAWTLLPSREPAPPPGDAPDGPHPLRDRRLWRVAGASGLLAGVQFTLIGFLVVYLVQTGMPAAGAAACLVGVQLAGAALRIGVGRWSDVLGTRVRPFAGIAVALAAAAAVAAAAATVSGATAGVAVLVAALLSQGWNGLSFTAAAELARRGRVGTALGVQNTVVAVSGALTLPLVGAVVDATSWAAGFAATAGMAALAAAVVAPLVRGESRTRRGRPVPG